MLRCRDRPRGDHFRLTPDLEIPQFLPALIRMSAQDLDALGGDPNTLTFSVQNASIPYEFDSQSPNAAALFWVRLPASSGNLVVEVREGGAPEPSAVWVVGYELVMHFSEPDVYRNSHNGAIFDVTPNRPITQARIPGPLGPALGLQPDEAIQLGRDLNMMSGAPGYSISAQIFPRNLVDFHTIFGVTTQDSDSSSRAQLLLQNGAMGTSTRVPDSSSSRLALSLEIPLQAWSHVRGQADFGNNNMHVEVNDQRTFFAAQFDADQSSTGPARFVTIGADEDMQSSFFDGVVDEIRLANVPRNTEWLNAERAALRPDFFIRQP